MRCIVVLGVALALLSVAAPAQADPVCDNLGVCIDVPLPTVTIQAPPILSTRTITLPAPAASTVTQTATTTQAAAPVTVTATATATRTATATATTTARTTARSTAKSTITATVNNTVAASATLSEPTRPKAGIDLVPDDPERAAATYSGLGLLAGLILGGIALWFVAKRSRRNGEDSMAEETLTAIRDGRGGDTDELPIVRTPTGRHRKIKEVI
jgi:hypothetical protein